MLESHDIWLTFIFILRLSLTISALLGFGLYLWCLTSSGDQSKSRMLNFLNGYLASIGIGFSLVLFVFYIVQPLKDEYLLYYYHHIASVRTGSVFICAVSLIFIFISGATTLNHFKPGLYLDISVSWSHKIAIPSSILAVVLGEYSLHSSCLEKFLDCQVFRLRTLVMIPATLTSFICQLVVIIDDIWGWRRIYTYLRELCRPNLVTAIDENIEIFDNNLQQPYHPSVDQHMVGVLFVLHYLLKLLNFSGVHLSYNWLHWILPV